jgi:hypothetical protein
MKFNAWTLTLIGAGLVTLPAVTQAEEKATPVTSALAATTLSGYVDTTAQWNIGNTGGNVPDYSFSQGKADGFNLNVVKLSLESPVNTADTWGAGYKVDLLAGPDANDYNTISTGSGNSQDFAIKQAYVALRAPVGNGLDFKMGVFDTLLGYEVSDGPNNPNITRSYGYTIEPQTHTGVLMSYQFCEAFSASAGVANTYGPTINERAVNADGSSREGYKAYTGAFTLTAPKSMGFLAGSTLTAGMISGFDSASVIGVKADQVSYYAGATVNTPVAGLKVGAAYDYAGVSGQDLTAGLTPDRGYANATTVYLSYQATEKLSFYGRFEYATSDTGAFLAREVYATTGTVQYDLWKNVLSRVELRWDHASNDAYGKDADKQNSYMLLANIAYKF